MGNTFALKYFILFCKIIQVLLMFWHICNILYQFCFLNKKG